jgi:hypothetical protein
MIAHRLPEDPTPGDDAWFHRYTQFVQAETRRQVLWKRQTWADLGDGPHAKFKEHTYPHILPEAEWRLNLFPPIAEAAEAYLVEENVEIHSERANLRSSQFACLNLLFPLKLNLLAAAKVLAPCLPGVRRVCGIEFEVTGDAAAVAFMGEPPGGKRGANRTSIDAEVTWTDEANAGTTRPHLTLIEWKYTEEGFGSCGGYASRGNPHPQTCERLHAATDRGASCYLASGTSSRVRRNYWKHTPPAWLSELAGSVGCPFRGPLYQLWRQQLLAGHFAATGGYSSVSLVAIHWSGNASLTDVPVALAHAVHGVETVGELWNRVTGGFSEVPVEALLRAFDAAPDPALATWRQYVGDRYGV